MSLTTSEMTPADIRAVTGATDGFGGGGSAWWIMILFLFAFMGNGFGGNESSVKDQYVLNSDFATLQRQLSDGFGAMERKGDGIANGLCDGFYNMNTTLLNGFNGVNQSISTQGYETRNAIQNAEVNAMQNSNALQQAISNGFCTTNFNNQNNTRDIIDSQNAGTRAILDAINSNKIEALKERISEQNQMIASLNLTASQQAQNAYLVEQLGTKYPIPAYLTCNPNANLNYSVTYGNGCGCA